MCAYHCSLLASILVLSANAQVALRPKVFLEGPFNSDTGTMTAALRTQPSFPLTEPFTALGFTMMGGSGEMIQASVLDMDGNNAVVDWVLVELHSATDPGTIMHTGCALLQSDGDVVPLNNNGVLVIPGATPGNYRVAIRHRNHLGVMTAAPVALSLNITTWDFTTGALDTYGSDALKTVGSYRVLRTGDAHRDGQIKYSGSNNDRDPILIRLGGIPNNVVSGYHPEDVTLDAQVKYTGSGNDRDAIMVAVGSNTPNNVVAQQIPPMCPTTVTDVDGNVYPVVQIGGQCWMAANLRTAHYSDGSIIPHVTDGYAWGQQNTGAWCNYDNDPANNATYGKIYNWFAAANPGICPLGWHAPTDAEWMTLESTLGVPAEELNIEGWHGVAQNVGGQMKTIDLWNSPNTGATNSSGFSSMPSGSRSSDGDFYLVGTDGPMWSSSEASELYARYRSLKYYQTGVLRHFFFKEVGLCMRCLRD